jgi:hypothetical protein
MRSGLVCCLAVWFSVDPPAAADDLIDSPMYSNPDLPAPPVIVLPSAAAVARCPGRPEEDYRRAAEAIARAPDGSEGAGRCCHLPCCGPRTTQQPGRCRRRGQLVVLDTVRRPALRAARPGRAR